jgi:hypothetical protein
MRTEPRRLTPSEQRLAAALDPAVARRLVALRNRIARLALLPDVSPAMLGAIAAEIRWIRHRMDDALDGQAGLWAYGSDLTPDNRHNIR